MDNILKSMLLGGILMIGGYQDASALQSTTYPVNIYPVTNQMVSAVKNAPNKVAALDALCGQGGVMRGKGLRAGNTCKLQDFARVAVVACQGYVKGNDTFQNSKCAQNVNKVLGVYGINTAKTFIQDNVKQGYTNITTFMCDTTPGYRDKLPDGLKAIAVNFCPKPFLARPSAIPARPATAVPEVPTPPGANAIAKPTPIVEEIRETRPPVEFDHFVQGALRDLSPRQSMVIDDLFAGQNYLLDALQGLEEKDQQMELQGVPATNPVRGKLVQQENALITNYDEAQTTLIKIKVELEQKKPLRPDLLAAAQKVSESIKNLAGALNKGQ